MNTDEVYAGLLRAALNGEERSVRGHACRTAGFAQAEFRSFPLVCLRRTAWRHALREFEWFLSGSTRVADLPEGLRRWWEPWGDGVGYGRFAPTLQAGGFSVWDPAGPLPPCTYSGFSATPTAAGLVVSMHQRSCDLLLGWPHDLAQLWAYSSWLAARAGTRLARVRWTCSDPHVYAQHEAAAELLLAQEPQESPGLAFDGVNEFRADLFRLVGDYKPAVHLPLELVV